ncbi:MAG TPA: FAD binding domain-containing protein [Pirellulales bacterium]|nr:FAD binding domain-containing protein [Pirellulales bacterium]
MIPPFRLWRPRSAAEAVAMRAEAGDGAVFMAGGIDIVNRMKFGEPITEVIYLGGVTELCTINDTEGGLHVGSLVTHHQFENCALIGARLPVLAQTWQDVANIRIRCKGTIGGNIMAADPNYDFALAAMAAGAHLDFLDQDGTARRISAIEVGGLSASGLLTGIIFPSADRLHVAFDRSLRPAITLALGLDCPEGKVAGGRVAIGCAFPMPITARLPITEPLLPRELVEKTAALARDLTVLLPEPLTNRHASARYRRQMIEVLLRRNLAALVERIA